jgi:transketolase C-terminal domain/subunit
VGGLGGAVAEVLAEMPEHAPLTRIGLAPRFNSAVGDQQYLKKRQGLDLDGVLKQLTPILEESHGLVS